MSVIFFYTCFLFLVALPLPPSSIAISLSSTPAADVWDKNLAIFFQSSLHSGEGAGAGLGVEEGGGDGGEE